MRDEILDQLYRQEIVLYDFNMQGRKSEAVTEAMFGLLGPMITHMRRVMKDNHGVGLSGVQLGIMLRIAVITIPAEDPDAPPAVDIVLCNPEIISSSGQEKLHEGCLSIPGCRAGVTRATRVRVKYQDEFGEWKEVEAEGLFARALQHEIDHMNGEVYLHLLSSLKRGMILRNLKKRYPTLKLPK